MRRRCKALSKRLNKVEASQQDLSNQVVQLQKRRDEPRRATKAAKRARRGSGKPAQPPSAFVLYMKSISSWLEGAANVRAKRASEAWQSMDAEAKAPFIQEAETKREQYHEALQVAGLGAAP